MVIVLAALRFADATLFRSLVRVDGVAVAEEVAEPLPALFETMSSVVQTLLITAAVALYATAMATASSRWAAPLLTIGFAFCLLLDSSASPAEAPWAFAQAAMLAGLLWLIGRYVLGANPLAWPVTLFLGFSASTAATLLHHHRADLRANAVALAIMLVLVIAWLISPREDASHVPVTESAGGSTETPTE